MTSPPLLKTPPAPGLQYIIMTMACMAMYILVNLLAILGIFDKLIDRPAGWLIAILAAIPVAGQIWASWRLMSTCDEYMRTLIAKAYILAAGFTLILWTAWGFGETYAAAAHLPAWLIYPVFMAVYGLVTPFIRSSH